MTEFKLRNYLSYNTYTISKLKKGKKYYVRVRAYNKGKKAYGDWSNKKAVKVK